MSCICQHFTESFQLCRGWKLTKQQQISNFFKSVTFTLKSFYQINSVQTEKLYAKAMELAGLSGKERVIDAYCGIGTIGLIAARKAKEVIGVELNGDAVRDAVRNAKMNAVENARLYENDAGIFMTEMAAAG